MIEKNNVIHFTIIIPTKDRAEYLYQTLRTCINQDYENLEIIVSDDGSVDNSRKLVEEIAKKDFRVRLISPGSGVGMLDNFEFALNHAKPGYVIALGGDDGLMPNSIARMRDILLETRMELLTWPTSTYFYPKTKMANGQLILHMIKGKLTSGLKIIKSKPFLERQAKNLFYISDIESPMIYVKSVVSTNLIAKVKSRSKEGRFYSCSTPDGYSGIVLAGEVDSYAYSGAPLSIHGVSPTSQGLGYLTKSKEAKEHSEEFFKKTEKQPMHIELASQPYSPLISLMTADFLLTARDLPGWPGKFSPIDYKSLLCKALTEIEDGLFPEASIARELNTLFNIAKYHNLLDFFTEKLNKSKKNSRRHLEGNAISPRLLYFDAVEYNIFNVFDASYVAHFAHQIIPKLSLKTFIKMILNSLRYRFLSFKKTKTALKHFIKYE
jgi:glycosyltransferase involved in cell wall biosynthesis